MDLLFERLAPVLLVRLSAARKFQFDVLLPHDSLELCYPVATNVIQGVESRNDGTSSAVWGHFGSARAVRIPVFEGSLLLALNDRLFACLIFRGYNRTQRGLLLWFGEKCRLAGHRKRFHFDLLYTVTPTSAPTGHGRTHRRRHLGCRCSASTRPRRQRPHPTPHP